MRWLKHICLAHEDKELGPFLEDHGLEGYGFYWLLLELIGAPIEKGSPPSLVHSEGQWARNLHVSTRVFRKFTQSLELRRLILTELVDDYGTKRIRITVANLLKYRDEYQKKSGHTLENEKPVSDHRAEQNRTEENRTDALATSDDDPPPNGKPAIAWQTDVRFAPFAEAAQRFWGGLIDADFKRAWLVFRDLEISDQLHAVSGVHERRAAGKNPRFVVRPEKYLRDREWERAVVPDEPVRNGSASPDDSKLLAKPTPRPEWMKGPKPS